MLTDGRKMSVMALTNVVRKVKIVLGLPVIYALDVITSQSKVLGSSYLINGNAQTK